MCWQVKKAANQPSACNDVSITRELFALPVHMSIHMRDPILSPEQPRSFLGVQVERNVRLLKSAGLWLLFRDAG